MSSYQFQSIIQEQKISFENKLFIWIWHADKIPPHVGISLGKKYFSLKVAGKDVLIHCTKSLAVAMAKKIPLVLVEMKKQLEIESVIHEFSKFSRAEVDFSTCLTPIKNLLNHPEANQLSDLLTRCEKDISAVYGFNLPPAYSALKEYSECDILNRLQLLANA